MAGYEFAQFLKKQEEVYTRFRDISKVKAEGTIDGIPKTPSGYFLMLRHGFVPSQTVDWYSNEVNKIIPALVYSAENVHTTLADILPKEAGTAISPDLDILYELEECLYQINPKNVEKMSITYPSWLFNNNSVIAAGYPNESFYDVVAEFNDKAKKNSQLIEKLNTQNLNLRMPWGAHITVARFLGKNELPEQMDKLTKLTEILPIGESRPNKLEVGFFTFKDNALEIKSYNGITLN